MILVFMILYLKKEEYWLKLIIFDAIVSNNLMFHNHFLDLMNITEVSIFRRFLALKEVTPL